MVKRSKKNYKINPNEFTGLLYDFSELDNILHVLCYGKIFRYASRNKSWVDKFESKIRKYFDIKYALGVNNGTSGLKTALRSINIKQGDRVLVSAYTFIATPASIISFGAIPIPIDFDQKTCMNLDQVKREIKKGCTAIIPVHLQGQAFDISAIMNLARKSGIPVIEDACQAFGASVKGVFAGCAGDIGVFSFQQYKQISSGEGGLLITNNSEYFKKAKIYSDHGIIRETMSWDSDEAMIGDNLRMNNIQGAILIPQLKKLPIAIRQQIQNRNFILKKIESNKMQSIVKSENATGETGMNIFFLVKNREIADKIINHAKQHKIEFRYLWDKPYYKHEVFKRYKLTPAQLGTEDCKIAENLASRLLSLSISPILTNNDILKIVLEINTLKKLNYIN